MADSNFELCLFAEDGDWQLSVVTGAEEGFEGPGPLSIIMYGDKGISKTIKVGDEEESVFKCAETKEFNLLEVIIFLSNMH